MNLEQIIKNEIAENGPIPFRDFMKLALYHPDLGYYSSGNSLIGRKGDFYTSPTVHSSFGKVISNLAVRTYDYLDTYNFTIIEIGAGKGYLAADIMDSIKSENPDIYKNLTYRIYETAKAPDPFQQEILNNHTHKIEWLTELNDLKNIPVEGLFLSNEFLDALPFHRLKQHSGDLMEIFVDIQDEKLVETLDYPSSNELIIYKELYAPELANSQQMEVNLEARKTIASISEVLKKGIVLTIDYGYLADELYSHKRREGTYRCFYRHELNSDPYSNIGVQDITADINFTDILKYGEKAGLTNLKYINQGQFLVDWGILDILQNYKGDEHKKDRLAIKNLIMPEMMGSRFKAVVQSKNIEVEKFYRDSDFQLIKKTL